MVFFLDEEFQEEDLEAIARVLDYNEANIDTQEDLTYQAQLQVRD
jgi:hypothetical protein